MNGTFGCVENVFLSPCPRVVWGQKRIVDTEFITVYLSVSSRQEEIVSRFVVDLYCALVST